MCVCVRAHTIGPGSLESLADTHPLEESGCEEKETAPRRGLRRRPDEQNRVRERGLWSQTWVPVLAPLTSS